MDKITTWSEMAESSAAHLITVSRAACTRRRRAGMALRATAVVVTLALTGLAPMVARAQSALQATQILVGVATQSNPGGPMTVQAVLADGQGHPISKATIFFTAPASFLKETGNIVLAEAVTNADGQAVAQFVDDFSGSITLTAEFRGDTQYSASNASVEVAAAGEQQVYVEHIGVDLPGFNVPPVLGSSRAAVQSPPTGIAGLIQRMWPAMNGWPIAAVLFIVWSTYLFAVRFVFRVAKLGGGSESGSHDTEGSL